MAVAIHDGTTLSQLAKVDNSGNLYVVVSSGTVSATNPSVGATGSSVPADATFVAAANATGNLTGLLVDNSGYLKVNVAAGGGSGGTSSSFGSAFPATGTAVGATDGTDMRALTVDGSGYLKVNVAAGSSGNSAASATGSGVPADADYVGFNSSGNLVGVSSSNPLPVTVSAVSTINTVTAVTSITNAVTVQGNVANGSAVSGSNAPVLIAGSDGTDVRTIATDGSGFQKIIGCQAAGSATTGDPVQIAGGDGTDVRLILTDSSGQVKVLVENTPAVTVTGTLTSVNTVTSVTAVSTLNTVTAVTAVGTVNTVTAVTTITNPVTVQNTPTTSGGWATSIQLALGTTAAAVKTSAGTLGGYAIYNAATTAVFVFWYNTSTVTVGTTTPLYVIGIPAGGAANVEFCNGIAFSSKIYVGCSTATNAGTAPGTATVVTSVYI